MTLYPIRHEGRDYFPGPTPWTRDWQALPVGAETVEFERCTTQIQALRTVHSRTLRSVLNGVSGEPLRALVDGMVRSIRESFLKLGARRSFVQLFADLRQALDTAQKDAQDLRDMLAGSFGKLNSEYGFSLSTPQAPELSRFRDDLALIGRGVPAAAA